jgi:hypothetical protein
VTNLPEMASRGYDSDQDTETIEEDLQPYLSLFVKPMTNKKSKFTNQELKRMCKDPLHSPRLIHYLICFVRDM